jgi:23S rRNA maturation-related 3'-5' exoribonuclease YhaM
MESNKRYAIECMMMLLDHIINHAPLKEIESPVRMMQGVLELKHMLDDMEDDGK